MKVKSPEDSARKRHKKSLSVFLENPRLNITWIVGVLKDCSLEEFDQHVTALEQRHGHYLKWTHIPEIRRRISQAQRFRDA